MSKQIITEKLKTALLQFNLTNKEILSYIALLEKGGSSIQDIAKYTEMNRVSTYAAIDELKKKGLVAETKKGKRKLFVAENLDSLKKILQQRRGQLETEEKMLSNLILPSLKAIDVHQENRPQIKFFEGVEGIYKIYDDYLLDNHSVIGCGTYDSVMKVSTLEIEKEFIDKVKKKKIFFRGILEDTPTNHKLDELSKGVMHNKFLPKDQKITADILVFGSMVALISYDKVVATLIEDESIAASIKMYLEFMWEHL